jgi:hypothetical protein
MMAFMTDCKTHKHTQLTVFVEYQIQKVPQQRQRLRTGYPFRQLHATSCLVDFEKQQREQAGQKEAQCS